MERPIQYTFIRSSPLSKNVKVYLGHYRKSIERRGVVHHDYRLENKSGKLISLYSSKDGKIPLFAGRPNVDRRPSKGVVVYDARGYIAQVGCREGPVYSMVDVKGKEYTWVGEEGSGGWVLMGVDGEVLARFRLKASLKTIGYLSIEKDDCCQSLVSLMFVAGFIIYTDSASLNDDDSS